jgi:16S rRNA (uracil1498-N3)-methyltransferase
MNPTPTREPRFYLDAPLRAGSTLTLPEESAHHAVHVLRLETGDAVALFNGRGGEYAARIASIQRLRIAIDVLQHRAVERESPLQMTLVQGVSSGDRMDFTVRKAVELGVAAIHPVVATRSVARPKGERAESRRAHWQKVVISACEQCGRNRIPEVHPLLAVADALRALPEGFMGILLSPRSELPLSKAVEGKNSFVLAAGPEAGFDPGEESDFAGAGFTPVKLGPRVLRTETAALAALAALSALRGDF